MDTNWDIFFLQEQNKEYYKKLQKFIEDEYEKYIVYPPKKEIYTAFMKTPLDKVKCVILGQDPYPGEGQAMGLSFSVPDDIKVPRSLQNIYKELNSEYGYSISQNGNLTCWAEQGVLLLNSILTVRSGEAASHQNKGWEIFTDNVLKFIDNKKEPVVFMLWGNYARSKKNLLKGSHHLVLEAAHPSPLSASRGFFGCNHFIKCNEFLNKNGLKEIEWKINT